MERKRNQNRSLVGKSEEKKHVHCLSVDGTGCNTQKKHVTELSGSL